MKFSLLLALCGTFCFAFPGRCDNLQFRTEKNPLLIDPFGHTDHFLGRLLEAYYDAHPDCSGMGVADGISDDPLVNSTLAYTDWKGCEHLSEEELLQKIADVASLKLTRYEGFFILQRQTITTRLQKLRGVGRRVKGHILSTEPYTGRLVELPDVFGRWSLVQPPYRTNPASQIQ